MIEFESLEEMSKYSKDFNCPVIINFYDKNGNISSYPIWKYLLEGQDRDRTKDELGEMIVDLYNGFKGLK